MKTALLLLACFSATDAAPVDESAMDKIVPDESFVESSFSANGGLNDDEIVESSLAEEKSQEELIPQEQASGKFSACDLQVEIEKHANAVFGKPGPMTVYIGHGEKPDAMLGAPCADEKLIYDHANKDSMWSASKLITGMVVGAMVEDGLFEWDEPLSSYLKWWTKDEKDLRSKITMKSLLSQTSGFGDHGCAYFPYMTYEQCAQLVYSQAYGKFEHGVSFSWGSHTVTPMFSKALFLAAWPHFPKPEHVEPGKFFFYSEAHWNIIGHLIEKLSGLTYEGAIKKYLTIPLGIDPPALLPAQGPHSDPGGGLWGEPEAYSKVLGAYFSGKLLSKKTTDIMETPWTLKYKSESVGQLVQPGGGYALGMWFQCDTPDCSNPPSFNSVGGRGFLPHFDRKNNYWALLARQSPTDALQFGASWSMHFFQLLAPKLAAMYGHPDTEFSTATCKVKTCGDMFGYSAMNADTSGWSIYCKQLKKRIEHSLKGHYAEYWHDDFCSSGTKKTCAELCRKSD
jgi:CubicO group peptidase (beta-lactamase class C family)